VTSCTRLVCSPRLAYAGCALSTSSGSPFRRLLMAAVAPVMMMAGYGARRPALRRLDYLVGATVSNVFRFGRHVSVIPIALAGVTSSCHSRLPSLDPSSFSAFPSTNTHTFLCRHIPPQHPHVPSLLPPLTQPLLHALPIKPLPQPGRSTHDHQGTPREGERAEEPVGNEDAQCER